MTNWESALARTLLHSLWEGAAVALGLALVLFCVRSSRARYGASAIALLALMVGLVVTFTHFASKQPVSVGKSWAVALQADSPKVAGGPTLLPTPGGGDLYFNLDYLSWIWLAGVLVFYVRGTAGWMAARRLRQTGVCCAAVAWQVRMDDLRDSLRLTRPVVLMESCLAEVPVMMGYVRPVILIPVGLLAGLPVDQVEAILLHELAHIRRYDYVVNMLQLCLEGLLFYHPAVWWISGVMRAERENCCDDVVVRATGGAYEYATALAALEERREFPRVALAANGSGLARRIQRLLGKPEQRFASAMPLVTAVALTLCVATLMVGWPVRPSVPLQKPMVVAQVVAPVEPVAPPVEVPPAAEPKPDAAPVSALAPAAPAMSLPDHKIVPNDLLSVMVYDEPGLSRSARVDADGKIAMPQLQDKIQAAGLMPRDIEKEVSAALVDGQILLHPVVTVSIVEYAERTISVVGDVRNPGQFKITTPISLLEALAKAGWVTNDAGPDVLLTTVDVPTPRKINLRDLQMSTDRTLNVTLTGGEVVNVPDAVKEIVARFSEGPKIWITGNVTHPLVYSIKDPAAATVLKVIAGAGGVTQNYAKTAYIYRLEGTGNRRSISIPLADIMHRKAQDVKLQADDVLLVPDSDTKKMQEYYETHPLTAPWEKAK